MASTQYFWIISDGMEVMVCTRFRLHGTYVYNEESESCLSCQRHAQEADDFMVWSGTCTTFWQRYSKNSWSVDNCYNNHSRPRWLTWMRRPTGDQEVAGSTPAEVGNILSWRLIMKYFLRSFSPFRWFKKGSYQFLTKECAQYWLTA